MANSTPNTSPFTVVYSFELKENTTEQFIEAWKSLTELIYEFEGSYGSRLHKVNDCHFVGYAQWPSRMVFEQSGNNLPEAATIYRDQMRGCCIKIEKLLELESVAKDLIQNKQHDRFNAKNTSL
ncbi:MAG: antibiotic biosynthesis monooxygenase [Fluviicola sp.]|nr:antibiotic biosynthesis monooxygenase [Fluviicola sp.]